MISFSNQGGPLTARDKSVVDDSLDAITDALLTASRLLVAISARSIADVDESITIPQFRTLVILESRGSVNLATLAGLLGVQPSTTGRMVEWLVTAGLMLEKSIGARGSGRIAVVEATFAADPRGCARRLRLRAGVSPVRDFRHPGV